MSPHGEGPYLGYRFRMSVGIVEKAVGTHRLAGFRWISTNIADGAAALAARALSVPGDSTVSCSVTRVTFHRDLHTLPVCFSFGIPGLTFHSTGKSGRTKGSWQQVAAESRDSREAGRRRQQFIKFAAQEA